MNNNSNSNGDISHALSDALAEAFPSVEARHATFVEALQERLVKRTRRTRYLMMRMSIAEHDALKNAARDAGCSVSDVVRYSLSRITSNGSLDDVARSHLATVKQVSAADRTDSSLTHRTRREQTEQEIYQDLQRTLYGSSSNEQAANYTQEQEPSEV